MSIVKYIRLLCKVYVCFFAFNVGGFSDIKSFSLVDEEVSSGISINGVNDFGSAIQTIKDSITNANYSKLLQIVDAGEEAGERYIEIIAKHFGETLPYLDEIDWVFDLKIVTEDLVVLTVKASQPRSKSARFILWKQRPLKLKYINGQWRLWFAAR